MFFSILHRCSSSASFIIIAFFFYLFLSLDLFFPFLLKWTIVVKQVLFSPTLVLLEFTTGAVVKLTLTEVPVLQGFNVNIWWQTEMLAHSQTCNIGLHYIYEIILYGSTVRVHDLSFCIDVSL